MLPYVPHLLPFAPAPHPVPVDTDWRGGVLVRSTNWLGDALMTLPAVSQLRRLLPEDRPLHILTPANLAPVWRACPFVDNVVTMANHHLSPSEAETIRKLDCGAALVLPNSFGSAMDIWKTRIPVRAGRRGRWRRLLLTHTIREWPRGENVGVCHQLSYYLELVSLFGSVELSAACPPLRVDSTLAAALGMDTAQPWLVIAPGAAYGPAKQWPAEYFVEVARWYDAHRGRVAIIGGGKEKPVAEAIAAQLPARTLNLAGRTDLTQLMSVLMAAQVVVANDSGAMHLAAGLGKDGVALFGSTDPVATGPIGGRWQLLVADVPCRPCFRRECPRQDAYRCLRSLEPQRVIDCL